MDKRILRYIDDAHAVPSVPQVVTRLLEVTADPDFDRKDVVRALSADPGIVSDIVRLANSCLYRAVNKVTSLDQAIGRLGIKRIRQLVVSRSLVSGLAASQTSLLDESYFWRRSLGSAVLAAHFGDLIQGVERDLAFLAGLLADIGVVILARAMPTEYRAVASLYAPRSGGDAWKLERETLAVSHAEVSALALERWSLPQELVLAIRHHHDDDLGAVPESAIRLAPLINAAGEIAACLCEAPDSDHIREICYGAMRTAGLDISALPAILKAVEPEIEELAGLLRLDIVPSKIFALIAESISEQVSVAGP